MVLEIQIQVINQLFHQAEPFLKKFDSMNRTNYYDNFRTSSTSVAPDLLNDKVDIKERFNRR